MAYQNTREQRVFTPHYQVHVYPSDLLRETVPTFHFHFSLFFVEIHVVPGLRLNPLVLLCSSADGKSEGGSFWRRQKFIPTGLKVIQIDSGLGLGV